MAVSLEPAAVQDKPPYLQKRGLGNETVHDFTFDLISYAFQKRASNVQVRIDYTDVPGYWGAIVGTLQSEFECNWRNHC
jgi:chitinase